jgi:hypothetical protein
VSCFNSHKGSVNRPNLGDTWHLGCGSTSPGMTSVSHVNPHHTVGIYPRGSIDPWSSLLRGSRLGAYRILSMQIPRRAKSPDSRIWRHASSSYQRPRFISAFTTSVSFHTCRLLARFLQSTKSLDYGIACHIPTHPTVLVQWTTFDSG